MARVLDNGALDNASGSAAMLAIAGAFAALPEPPRRSVLFLGVTPRLEGGGGEGRLIEPRPFERADFA